MHCVISCDSFAGENNPALHHSMKSICQLYPKELVDRCSPSYMKDLIDKFKRESMKSDAPKTDCIDESDHDDHDSDSVSSQNTEEGTSAQE